MKMTKKKLIALLLVAALAIGTAVAVFAGCGSTEITGFTMDKEGKFSFTGFGSAERYIVEVYNSADVKDGVIADGAEYAARITVPANSDTIEGTIDEVASLPWGEYTALAFGVVAEGDGTVRTDPASATFAREGKLSVPTVTYSTRGFEVTVTISSDSLTKYKTSEALTTFTMEAYSDSACSSKLGEVSISTPTEQQGSGRPGPNTGGGWTGNTATFDYEDGTVGTDATIYVRTRANASTDGKAQASDWSAVQEFTLNGLVIESGLDASYFTGNAVSAAATYSKTGFELSVESSRFPFGTTITNYTGCTATLAFTAEGGFTYTLTGTKEGESSPATITELDGKAKVDGRQYWFEYEQQSSGGFPGFPGGPGGFPGGPGGGGSSTTYAGGFASADGNTMTVDFGDGQFELAKA